MRLGVVSTAIAVSLACATPVLADFDSSKAFMIESDFASVAVAVGARSKDGFARASSFVPLVPDGRVELPSASTLCILFNHFHRGLPDDAKKTLLFRLNLYDVPAGGVYESKKPNVVLNEVNMPVPLPKDVPVTYSLTDNPSTRRLVNACFNVPGGKVYALEVTGDGVPPEPRVFLMTVKAAP